MKVLAVAAFVLAVQPVQSRSGVLQGTVVSSVGAMPVANVHVVVARIGGTVADYRVAETDGAGQFFINNLPAGSYRVYTERVGYLRGEYGRRLATGSGTPVVVTEGLAISPVRITMIPTGVIAGRVLDRGRPAQRVWVRALKPSYSIGVRSFQISAWAETDDLGEYRLFGLEPGSYFVSAIPQWKARIEGDNQVTPIIPTNANKNTRAVTVPLAVNTLDPDVFDPHVYPAVYHPGTPDIGAATAIDVQPGSTATANPLSITRVLPRTVRGRVTLDAGDGQPPPSVSVSARQVLDGTNLTVPSVNTTADFVLSRIPPGRYQLVARTVGNAPLRVGGLMEIEVGERDLDGLVLPLTRAVTVTGRVRIDGRPLTATDPRVSVQLYGGAGFSGIGAQPVQPDGTFTLASVLPNEYRLRVIQAGRIPWVKSARYGSDDVTYARVNVASFQAARELEIDLSTATSVLEASVVDGERRPVAGALVIAVPDAARRAQSTLFRSATTDAQGRVRLEDVVPGEYRVFATTEIAAPAWQDQSVIRRFESRGELVRLAERGSVNVSLRILEGPRVSFRMKTETSVSNSTGAQLEFPPCAETTPEVLAPQGTGVSGTVIDAASKDPIAGARVLLARVDGPVTGSIVVETDDRGRFVVANPPAGTYRLFADEPRYLRAEHTAPVAVVAGVKVSPIGIALIRRGVITGRVLSERGDPVAGVYVRAWNASGQAAETRTNDLGEYRLFGLAPGAYIVSAEPYPAPRIEGANYIGPTPPCPDCPGEGAFRQSLANLTKTGTFIDPRVVENRSYPAVFFPATTDRAAAASLDVAAGAVVAGIDLQLVRR